MLELQNQRVADAVWVTENPNSVMLVTKRGMVYIYDLSESIDKPAEEYELNIKETDSVVGIASSKNQGIYVFLTMNGTMLQFELGDNLKGNGFVLNSYYPS